MVSKKNIIAFVMLISGIILLIIFALKEQKNFIKDNNCIKINESQPQTAFIFSSNGGTSTIISTGQTTYLCDDGVEYSF